MLGLFFVRNKNGRLRVIVDTRDVNGSFRDPPSTRLPSAAALPSLETWELVESGDRKTLRLSGGDICVCFHHCEVLKGLARWFSLPPLRARLAPHVKINGGRPDGNNLLVPCLCTLPMGWAWSTHIAQRLHEFRSARAGLGADSRLVEQKQDFSLTSGKSAHAICVDNLCVVSADRTACSAQGSRMAQELTSSGLPVHGAVDAEDELDFVGLHFSGAGHEVRLAWPRLWKLRLALDFGLEHPWLTSHQLEKLVGLLTC